MNNAMGIYVTKLAEKARCLCEECNVVPKDMLAMSFEEIQAVVQFYKGKMKQIEHDELIRKCQNSNTTCFIQKVEENLDLQFIIYYTEFTVMSILHELGHAFLDLSDMQANETCCYRDVSYGLNEIAASKFARAFIMPTELLKKVVLKNLKNGFCDVEAVAKTFGVETTQVISRGREIYLWE